jgi:hypothetical protein
VLTIRLVPARRSPAIFYTPDPSLDRKAVEFGESMRKVLFDASGRGELHSYVNYAHGDETTEQMYGFEVWRQERLSGLKQKYDPLSKLSFYAPIRSY